MVLGSSQFLLLLQLPQKTMLATKVVKICSKIIISLCKSKSVTYALVWLCVTYKVVDFKLWIFYSLECKTHLSDDVINANLLTFAWRNKMFSHSIFSITGFAKNLWHLNDHGTKTVFIYSYIVWPFNFRRKFWLVYV